MTDCTRTATTPANPTPASTPEQAAPRLVVLIVVDQLPSWSFDPQTPLLEGGIARLLREGTYYPYGVYPYANTYTSPGHATIATGVPPSEHGILANRWYDRELERVRTSVDDPTTPSFIIAEQGDPASVAPAGVSGSALRVEGLADAWRRQTRGRARTVAVGLKERATALVLGQRPDLAIWYDEAAVSMTTSKAYVQTPPAWLLERADDVRSRLDYTWQPLDPALLAKVTQLPDDSSGEGRAAGLDRSFPHALAESSTPAAALLFTPLGNDIVIDTALAAVEHEQLGNDEIPDLLALTFSAHDYAGHLWGQESWERLDMFLRLDRELERFFARLDAEVGEGRWAAVLTSDHGATPLVERSLSGGHRARRITFEEIGNAVDATLDGVLRPHDWVLAVEASTVYLDAAFFEQPPEARDEALRRATAAVREIDGVHFAAPTHELTGGCEARTDDDALVCRGVDAQRSGELFFTAAKWHVLVAADDGEGTQHGSINDEDRVVPIIVMDPRREPGVREGPVSMLQVAPTVTSLLGGQPPRSAQASPL